jgi:hypothetical protein
MTGSDWPHNASEILWSHLGYTWTRRYRLLDENQGTEYEPNLFETDEIFDLLLAWVRGTRAYREPG